MAKRKPAAKSRKKTETPWEQIGLVTISTGSLLLIDPVDVNEYDDADRSDSDYEVESVKRRVRQLSQPPGWATEFILSKAAITGTKTPASPPTSVSPRSA